MNRYSLLEMQQISVYVLFWTGYPALGPKLPLVIQALPKSVASRTLLSIHTKSQVLINGKPRILEMLFCQQYMFEKACWIQAKAWIKERQPSMLCTAYNGRVTLHKLKVKYLLQNRRKSWYRYSIITSKIPKFNKCWTDYVPTSE